jgi:hypothetical protein
MVGSTLIDIRERIDELATADGRYYVVCGRTGNRPVPAASSRFPDRATARTAARATGQYRRALRRYDPRVPHCDLIVCEETGSETATGRRRESAFETLPERRGEPSTAEGATSSERSLVEFCHRVAGATFETLSVTGHDDVERAVMDAYFDLAETVGDPDELCLCLLESTAVELEARLEPTEQARVVAGAAARLDPPTADADPFDAALAALGRRGVIGGYTRCPSSSDGTDRAEAVVRVDGYAFSGRDGRLPVLPLTVELSRHRAARLSRSLRATAVDGGWRLAFEPVEEGARCGLVSAPITGGT